MASASERIEEIVGPSLAAMGYELVRVALGAAAGRTVLQVMVERADRAETTVEDCARASRAISAVLDVEDPLPGAYSLEVSSPGIDRPLTRPEDFSRFAGFEARIELARPRADGRKRLRGRLRGLDGDGAVALETGDGRTAIPRADIRAAKLVLTDDLIEAGRARRL